MANKNRRTSEWPREIPHDGRPWHSYPIGTVARDTTGAFWIRTAGGWKANGGNTFPTPSADASFVLVPNHSEER